MRYQAGPEVLSNINCVIERGMFWFVSGVSGAGKSSFLRLLYMDERPSRGDMRLFGRDVYDISRDELPVIRRRIGVVFQDFRLINQFTVFDNVALALRVRDDKISETMLRAQVSEFLDWVGLKDKAGSYPPMLSGGQKQRVAIARAVIGNPHLLIADEPTGNVDDATATRLFYLFEELNRRGTTVLIATHNRPLMEASGKPVLLLKDGYLTPLKRLP